MTTIRQPDTFVVLMDGTLASLERGQRTSIARIHSLLCSHPSPVPHSLRIHYSAGEQWNAWRHLPSLAMGSALEVHIALAYDWLARHWQPQDPLFMFGYSRGAFGVRSLAGMIDRVGLLKPEFVTKQHARRAWQLYRDRADEQTRARFRDRYCHPAVPIRMIGTFDTVKALGLRLPFLWMLTASRFRFHDEQLGPHIEHGVQALALDETRSAFYPVMWDSTDTAGRVEQMWFRGCHPDIGGQLNGMEFARPLANIPLVWMLTKAQSYGLDLPQDWQRHFPCDRTAPSVGSWRQWGKAFLARAPRVAGQDPSETLHISVPQPYTGSAQLVGALESAAPQRRPRRPPRQIIDEDALPR